MKEYIVELENITRAYDLGTTKVIAVADVSLQITRGEFTTLVGPSGSGKSTILHLCSGLDKPSSGVVKFLGEDLCFRNDKKMSKIRNEKIGFIFQSFNLIPVLNVYENIEYPTLIHATNRKNRKRIEFLLEEVGLIDKKNKRPNQLSGGERQRVSIARALVNYPDIVFADEPTANLDHENGEIIMDLMKSMNKKYGTTFLFSTHDPLIKSKAKRIIRLFDGKLHGDDHDNIKS